MGNKKINCKHGLTRKEEIAARRLRQKIEANDPDTWAEIIKLREKWLEEDVEEIFFLDYLSKSGHTVLYSAIMRITDNNIILDIYIKDKV